MFTPLRSKGAVGLRSTYASLSRAPPYSTSWMPKLNEMTSYASGACVVLTISVALRQPSPYRIGAESPVIHGGPAPAPTIKSAAFMAAFTGNDKAAAGSDFSGHGALVYWFRREEGRGAMADATLNPSTQHKSQHCRNENKARERQHAGFKALGPMLKKALGLII
jgi:hypothetical protein